MISELPWTEIEPSSDGSVQGRLVSENTRWQLYWARTSENPWMLAMEHSVARVGNLPEYQGLVAENRTTPNGKSVLLLKLENESLQDVFYVFCLDLIKIVNLESIEELAVGKLLSEIRRWHRLLNSSSSSLSFEREQGLVAELHIFSSILDRTSPEFVLDAWAGPLGSAKDFISSDSAIEVKSVGGTAEKIVNISSEFQLDLENMTSLHLAVVALASDGSGETVQEIVQKLSGRLAQLDLQERFNVLLNLSGFLESETRSDRTWTVIEETIFDLDAEFPSLSSSTLPKEIRSVKYKIDLSTCKEWQCDSEEMYQKFLRKIYD